ncbi:hypothetical protein [Tateyamaria sp. SN3-11]|uniref:hypothetical protein n=1 Tax=Tateyamaria sp. SN3-11 TaxID=3092147 RepID=UPI0039EC53CD
MAYVTHTQSNVLSNIWDSISSFFSMFSRALTVSAAMEARMRRIDALNAKTDAELSAMNLRRADIPAYVFRDLMHI